MFNLMFKIPGSFSFGNYLFLDDRGKFRDFEINQSKPRFHGLNLKYETVLVSGVITAGRFGAMLFELKRLITRMKMKFKIHFFLNRICTK